MDRAIVALLGHSFIGRLHTAVLDSNFPSNSNLNQDIVDVHYFGRSGATTKTLLSSRHIQDCIECKPVRVFLQIGGNDIRKNTTYVDVVKGIRFVVDKTYSRRCPTYHHHCSSTRYGWYGSDRTTFLGWYGKPYHNFDRKK